MAITLLLATELCSSSSMAKWLLEYIGGSPTTSLSFWTLSKYF